MRLIAASECRRVRWKNDGGWTTEIARSGDTTCGEGGFRWRVSIAEIESDGVFSAFPGVTRDLLLLDGDGIELAIGDDPPLQLTQRFERAHFDGAAAVHCRLPGGPARAFNVMARFDAAHAQVFARPLLGPMMLFQDAGVEWLVHAFAGQATIRGSGSSIELETGASAVIDFRDSPRLAIDGGGELLFVKFALSSSTSADTRGSTRRAPRADPQIR